MCLVLCPRWPVSQGSKITEYCSKQHLDPRNLAGFEPALRFYLRSGNTLADATGVATGCGNILSVATSSKARGGCLCMSACSMVCAQ